MAERAPVGDAAPAAVEHHSSLEPWIIETFCTPVLDRLPRRLAPNTISLTTHLLSWAVVALALLAPTLSAAGRTAALLGAGIGTFAATLTDCLDGMQARRTNRCSKLGEMLDHWLDAIHVPLLTVGIVTVLDLEPWAAVAIHLLGALVFNAQLVLHNRSGRFVHGSTSGTDATFGASVGYVVVALALLLVERRSSWVEMAVTVAVVVAIAVHLKLVVFYYRQLGAGIAYHLPFVLSSAGLATLYLLGAIGRLPFLFAIVFVSFRISGGFVLATIVGRRHTGIDFGMGAWIVAAAAAYGLGPGIRVAGLELPALLVWLGCGYLVGRNLLDLARNFSLLRPGSGPAAPAAS